MGRRSQLDGAGVGRSPLTRPVQGNPPGEASPPGVSGAPGRGGGLISLLGPALNVKLIKEATELINIPQIGF